MAQPATVRILDQHSNPVEGVSVQAYDSDNLYRQDHDFTDAAGEVTFAALDEGFIYLRMNGSPAHALITTPQRIKVNTPPPNNIFEVEAITKEAPVPQDEDMCACYGWFNRPDMVGRKVAIHITSLEDPIHASARETASPLVVESDNEGYVEVELVRNGIYSFLVPGYEDEPIIARIGFPDQAELTSVDLVQLLFPTPTVLVFDPPGPLALLEGDTSELVDTYLTMSPGYRLDGTTWEDTSIVRYIQYTSDDESVATVSPAADGTPIITAVGAGTCTISAEILDLDDVVPRIRLPASLTVTGVSVTVT